MLRIYFIGMLLLYFSYFPYEYCDCCNFCLMNVVVIYDAERTGVGYVCLWEENVSGANFLNLFNSCYHMVGRSSEVLLSKYDYIVMETIRVNNREYFIAVQGIDQTKTGTFQDICIYHKR